MGSLLDIHHITYEKIPLEKSLGSLPLLYEFSNIEICNANWKVTHMILTIIRGLKDLTQLSYNDI